MSEGSESLRSLSETSSILAWRDMVGGGYVYVALGV